MKRPSFRRLSLSLALAGVLVAGVGCGGGYSDPYYEPTGDATLTNFDGVATESFAMAPTGSGAWTGDLLYDYVFPGESVFIGEFYEDYYDADALQADGFLFEFDAVPIYAGEPTDFEVF